VQITGPAPAGAAHAVSCTMTFLAAAFNMRLPRSVFTAGGPAVAAAGLVVAVSDTFRLLLMIATVFAPVAPPLAPDASMARTLGMMILKFKWAVALNAAPGAPLARCESAAAISGNSTTAALSEPRSGHDHCTILPTSKVTAGRKPAEAPDVLHASQPPRRRRGHEADCPNQSILALRY